MLNLLFRMMVLRAIVCRGRRPTGYGTIPGDSFIHSSRHTLQFGAVKLLRRASNSHTLYVRSLVLFVAVILFARIVLLAAIHHMIAMIPLTAKVQIATITLLHSHACCRVGSCHISGVCATH